MISFQLVMFRQGGTSPFWVSTVEQASFGSFAGGDLFSVANERLVIDKVAHAFAGSGSNVVHVTSLILAPIPHAAEFEGGDFVPWPWLNQLPSGWDHGNA